MFQQKMQEEEENRFCIYRNKTFNRRKIMIIFVAVLLLMVFLMGRLVYLMIFCSEYYGVRAENLHERERDIKAARGNIYDRNGVVLAENKTVCTISVIHSQIEDPEKVIAVLTKELGMSEETVRKRVEKVSSIERIKTNVEKETGDAIRSYELAGVKIDEDYKRYYPYNELASKVIGFTGGDNQGIIGIEVKYDEYLEGINGKILTLTDARGVEIKNAGERRSEPVEGDDLYLSLDYNIQMYAAQAAVKVREEKQADSVSILVMNPQNGEILAMVNEPEFNLNEPFALNTENDTELSEEEKQDALNKMWRNQCINDTYEPGSTFKIITASAALEEGKVSLSDQFNCPGYKIVEDRRIRCHKVGGHGAEDFTHGIMNSCNPVFIEIGLRIGSDRFCDYFEQFGFEIENFGGREYRISAVPSNLYGLTEEELFLEMLDNLASDNSKDTLDIFAARLATMACKAAVKGNHAMSHQEAEKLIDELLTLENPYHCPHGRPTIIAMTRTELEKKFKRIV